MMRKNANSLEIDGPHYIVGLLTIFKQFHTDNYKHYIMLLTHFFKNIIHANGLAKTPSQQLPHEGYMTLAFLEELIKFEGGSREVISQNIGTFVFDCYRQ